MIILEQYLLSQRTFAGSTSLPFGTNFTYPCIPAYIILEEKEVFFIMLLSALYPRPYNCSRIACPHGMMMPLLCIKCSAAYPSYDIPTRKKENNDSQ